MHFSIILATSFRTSIFVEFCAVLGVNMAPTWHHFGIPKRIRIEWKIVVDSDAFLNASWTRFWEDFGKQNEGFWHVIFMIFSFCTEKRESLKTIVFVIPEGLSTLSEDRKINENSLKNQSKFESQLGVPLGIDFS